jgi:hypothetical protein
MSENNPAFQRWERGRTALSPEETAENHRVNRPFGTNSLYCPHPALKRWAIVAHPSGTGIELARDNMPALRAGCADFLTGPAPHQNTAE